MTYHQHPHTPDWVYEGDRAIGQAKTTVDAAAFVAAFNRMANPKDGPLKWGCKIVRLSDGDWDIQSPTGVYWWCRGQREWLKYSSGGVDRFGIYAEHGKAAAILNACTIPPPDYSEPRHPCKECGKVMEYDKGEHGDPQTMANPMGGCPPVPAGWCCECGHFEELERKDDDE